MLNQFDTQLVFKTTSYKDLKALEKVNKNLNVITRLPKGVCVDVRDVELKLYSFKKPISKAIPTYILGKTPSCAIEVKTGKTSKTYDTSRDAEIKGAIIDYLSVKRLGYVTRMARDLAPKFGKDQMKFKAELHRLLGELIVEGIVAKEEFIGVDGVRRVLYWLKEKGKSPLHLALVDNTYNILQS